MIESLKSDLVQAQGDFLDMEAKVGTEDYLAYMGQYKKDNFDELYDDACEKKKWDENNYKLKQKLKKVKAHLDTADHNPSVAVDLEKYLLYEKYMGRELTDGNKAYKMLTLQQEL